MIFPRIVAAASGSWQPAPPLHFQEPSPDAVRLVGPVWCSSGITIGTTAAAYVGDGWRTGQVVATGLTWAAVTTTRYGTHTVRDRRNLLLTQEACRYRQALAKWRRDHQPSDGEGEP